jgi:anti-sigma factor ChrR (cupin superfamily)
MNRRVVSVAETPFLTYDLDGPVQPEMSWLPVSYKREDGRGSYLMRMQPGAVTIEHDHRGFEEFLVIEGELIDSDGTVFKAGEFVSFDPGTRHWSRTETGCLLAVFEWRP